VQHGCGECQVNERHPQQKAAADGDGPAEDGLHPGAPALRLHDIAPWASAVVLDTLKTFTD